MEHPRYRRGLGGAALVGATTALLFPLVSGADPSAPASAQVAVEPDSALGTIVGVVTSKSQAPVAHATVTAVRKDGSATRATLSTSDGVYSFADLPAGVWSISADANGGSAISTSMVTVVQNRATRLDIVVAGTMVAAASPPGNQKVGLAEFLAKMQFRMLKDDAARTAAYAADKPVVVNRTAMAVPTSAAVSADPMLLAQASTAPAPAAAPTPAPQFPEAFQSHDAGPDNDTVTPLANVPDIGWMNGNTREKAPIFDTKFFTPEIRFDMNYIQSQNHPVDHTIDGSTEEFRSSEFQIEQVSFGGNFHWNNVQARFLSMMGNFSTATTRNDASAAIGQWDLQGAYKYFSEANAGYHWDNIGHWFSVDAGIFVSYIGLFSYYNFDNWTYQPSFVSSNTPWFFNGVRIQYWPTQNLKIEPWLINGWQSNAKFNSHPGFGGQILWIPTDNLKLVFNSYLFGQDNLASGSGYPNNGGGTIAAGTPNPNAPYINYAKVQRFHEDDSILYRYYESHGKGGKGISKAAFSLTADVGCEEGGGVTCFNGINKANFIGVMAYDRTWFDHDLYAITVGGGFMNNPGRYLALVPPINGASAASGTPYFTENPGQKLFQYDAQLNFQYMPKDWITWWAETTYRHSNVPYWSGAGGITPVLGNNGSPSSYACNNGSAMGADNCSSEGGVWNPDLRNNEIVWGLGVMVKF